MLKALLGLALVSLVTRKGRQLRLLSLCHCFWKDWSFYLQLLKFELTTAHHNDKIKVSKMGDTKNVTQYT